MHGYTHGYMHGYMHGCLTPIAMHGCGVRELTGGCLLGGIHYVVKVSSTVQSAANRYHGRGLHTGTADPHCHGCGGPQHEGVQAAARRKAGAVMTAVRLPAD